MKKSPNLFELMDIADTTEGNEDVGLGRAEIRTDDLTNSYGRQVPQWVVKPTQIQGFDTSEKFLYFDFNGG